MTGDAELIERLILEANGLGAAQVNLNRAIEAGEKAAAALTNEKLANRKLSEQIERLTERANEAERLLATFYQAAIFLMREVSDPTKHLRQQRIDAAVSNLRKVSAAAANYCNEIPF